MIKTPGRLYRQLTLFPPECIIALHRKGLAMKIMNLRTDITTPARRIAREVNNQPPETRLYFDVNGRLLYGHPASCFQPPVDPEVVATTCGLRGSLERMSWRQAQDLLDTPPGEDYYVYAYELASARRRAEEEGEGW